jgi:hypothetical protein
MRAYSFLSRDDVARIVQKLIRACIHPAMRKWAPRHPFQICRDCHTHMPFFRDRCICILYSHLTDENGVCSQAMRKHDALCIYPAMRKPTEPDQPLQYPQQTYLSYSLQASSSRQVLYSESETHKKTDVGSRQPDPTCQ